MANGASAATSAETKRTDASSNYAPTHATANNNRVAIGNANSSSSPSKNNNNNNNNNNKTISDNVLYGSMNQIPDATTSSPRPPDGDWGWFVVFASFLIHVVTDGITYSFGVFYLELLYYFQESKGATAWIASVLVGVTLCSGPISGSFVNKYGCRSVTIVGAILASGCLLASVWARSIVTLYFTIGLGTGLGFGLIYLPAIVSVTCYFEKYRSLATGIAVCGSGLGTLVFAPFLEYLISIYGWRGTMMICAGIVLNCIVLGAFFRPLKAETSKSKRPDQNAIETNRTRVPVDGRQQRADSLINTNDDSLSFQVKTNYRNEIPTVNVLRSALSQPILIPKMTNYSDLTTRSLGNGGVMNRHDALYQGSMENIRNHSGFLALDAGEEVIALDTSWKSASKQAESKSNVHNELEHLPCTEKKTDIFHEMMDFSLLNDPVFILFTLSNFCTSLGFNVPYVYLLPQAEERGISKTVASYLLAVIGVANTFGRIILGYLSDKPWINRLLVYNLCLTICGIATVFSTYCSSFGTFVFYCVVYGFTAGAYVGLTSVILVDLLGLNRLTNAFGLLLLFQGFASLLGPPIAGWMYDALFSYDPGFYAAGSMIAISGLMLFFIPPLQRKMQLNKIKRKEKYSNNEFA